MKLRDAITRLAVLAVAACSDPYGDRPCLSGSVRAPGEPGCAAPLVDFRIDGQIDKWRRIDALGVARSETTLFFHIYTGTRPRDGSMRWVLGLRDPNELATAVDNHVINIIVGGVEPRFFLNGVYLGRLSVEASYTDSGIEVAIPLDLVPFDGEAIAEDFPLVFEDGQFVPVVSFNFGYHVCWDPTRADNGCASSLP